MEEKPCTKGRALVLCGGGGKGAFQIGAWKALEEARLLDDVTAISGTSVGALNAVLFALGDFALADKIWSSIRPQTLLPFSDLVEKIVRVASAQDSTRAIRQVMEEGIFSRRGLERIIDSLDMNAVSRCSKPIFIGISDAQMLLPLYKTEFVTLNGRPPQEIKRILLASSAIPLIYSREKIGRREFVDGGFLRGSGNTPFVPVYEAGYRDILIITLECDFDMNEIRDFMIERLDVSRFDDCKFTVIRPLSPLGGVFDGVLNFSPEKIARTMAQGYFNTLQQLQESKLIGNR